jgi:hypothetical protein
MNWRLLAPLALFGPVIGALTVAGVFPRGADRWVWLGVVAVSAVLIARREPRRAIKHGALIGFWNGATSTLIQALFMDPLLAHNPWMVEAFARQPKGFDMQFFLFMLVPFIGVAGGAVTALLSILFVRFRNSG